ncbi:ABC transporter permease [Clavibacter michiganensis]|uniref:ABC transporter permease n=1 Tax=Clavibacter michiganensis TaxID=28447 RepID=UPI001365B693|nr:ABC transporter permease [Clavibacter michiganensis]MDO4026319.1 ABC transporter permease [Clavibacter michiganensis]MDO4034822.1 ABC transporter permease [Clavibacter michiganensis]MDO4048242.1 ABC transporter permease [Clavibacter michiganensis]MDO4105784.1 ABC transporter permease [Clavibacter michiganensis]MDO4132754.1 ABC transporter permease [Clavibacter michiganensis]
MSAVTEARTDAVGGAQSWRGLIAQPVAIAAVLGAYLVWLAVAPLTAVERTTLEPAALGRSTLEHLVLTFSAAAIVLVIAVPLGVLLTRGRFRGYSAPVLAVANFGQAAPAIGLVVLLSMVMTGSGSGFTASLVALVLYAALPVLRNTMIGIRGVDERLVEAGRGMGMSRASVLFRIELPLAVPVMLAGIRTALVLLVGTAALAAFVNGGGLGVLITTGVSLYLYPVLVSGALLISLLALAIDWLGRVVEHVARPKGL